INARFIRYNQDIAYGPIILYETKEDIMLNYISCFINTTEVGNTCKINVKQRSRDIPDYLCTIQFLSSGSVRNFFSYVVNNTNDNEYEIISLPFGGYVKIDLLDDSSNITRFNLTLYNETGGIDRIDLSNIQIESNFFGAHTMDALYNNSILFAKPDDKSSWSIIGYHMKEYETDTDSLYQEQLPGITGNLWIVKTEPIHHSVTGYLRLSESGTKYFKNLTSESQQTYINKLSEKLVKSIPIDPSRLKFSGRFETDSSGQILFELSINAQQNSQIIDDLNTIVGNKRITNLADVDIDKHYLFTPRSLSDKNFDVGNDMEIYDGKNKFTNEPSLYESE
ncbi:10431_t:CDS:2, partial [Racocetra fulgida]